MNVAIELGSIVGFEELGRAEGGAEGLVDFLKLGLLLGWVVGWSDGDEEGLFVWKEGENEGKEEFLIVVESDGCIDGFVDN